MTMTNEALRSNRRLPAEPGGRPRQTRRAPLERSCARRSAAHHDRRVEGRGRRSSQQPVLRVPPQRGDLVTLCLDLRTPTRVLQVGGDGRDRVAPHPSRSLPAPAGHRSHRLRGHPARPPSQQVPADEGREHHPRDEQRHLRRHLLGSSRTSLPTTESSISARSCKRTRTLHPSSPASRRSTKVAVPWNPGGRTWKPPDRRRAHLGGQRPAPRARAARLGATQFRSPLVRIRPARLDGFRNQLRGDRSAPSGDVLHVVLPLLPHARCPTCRARADVAEDHSLRRPVALARRERRSLLPELRFRHAPGRREPATSSRRSAQGRVDALRRTPLTCLVLRRPAVSRFRARPRGRCSRRCRWC